MNRRGFLAAMFAAPIAGAAALLEDDGVTLNAVSHPTYEEVEVCGFGPGPIEGSTTDLARYTYEVRDLSEGALEEMCEELYYAGYSWSRIGYRVTPSGAFEYFHERIPLDDIR